MSGVEIERLDAGSFAAVTAELGDVLADAVSGGASVGFLKPFTSAEAAAWWRTLAEDIAAGRRMILVARIDRRLVGTVQLRVAELPNARHRAEVAKLLVHRSVRRRGVGRALMDAIEALARSEGRTLLVLDTETGSDAQRLYETLGWTRVAPIPRYAKDPDGVLRATTIYFKEVQ